jgi:hypothetical protein
MNFAVTADHRHKPFCLKDPPVGRQDSADVFRMQ